MSGFHMEIDHSSATKGVIDTISAIESNTSIGEDELVNFLQKKGYSRIEAEKLNVFVPSAFSWPIIKKLEIDSLPDHFIAMSIDGAEVRIEVGSQHYFTAALVLAFSTIENGWNAIVSRKAYETVAGRSAEMDAVNKVLDAGGSLRGATLSPLVLERLSAEELLGES